MHRIDSIGRHIDHADAAFRNAPAHRRRRTTRTFESNVVLCLRVARIYRTVHRMDGQIEKCSADTADLCRDGGVRRICVDGEKIEIGQREFDFRAPVGAGLVAPCGSIETHNQAGAGRGDIFHITVWQGFGRTHRVTMQRRGAVTRHERRGVDLAAIGAHGQCARRIGKQSENRQRFAIERFVECICIEYPYVCTPQARRGEAGVGESGPVLTACRSGDKGAITIGTGKNDIAWLVPNLQRAQHTRRAIETYHAHRIGKVIDHPDFIAVALTHCYRFEPHRDRAGQPQRIAFDGVDLQTICRRVGDVKPLAIER